MDLSLIPLFFFEKACLFVFMALVFLFAETSGASSFLAKAPEKQEPLKNAVKDPDFKLKSAHPSERFNREREEPKARGVILRFHRWPNSKRRRLIFKLLGKSGLKKTETIKSFKVWLFEWPEGLRPVKKALEACENLPKMSILDYCESDTLLSVNAHNQRDIKTFQNERKWFSPVNVHNWRDARASGSNKNLFSILTRKQAFTCSHPLTETSGDVIT